MQRLSWAAGVGMLHLMQSTNEEIHKVYEKVRGTRLGEIKFKILHCEYQESIVLGLFTIEQLDKKYGVGGGGCCLTHSLSRSCKLKTSQRVRKAPLQSPTGELHYNNSAQSLCILCSSWKYLYSSHRKFLFCSPSPPGHSSFASYLSSESLAFVTALSLGISNDFLFGEYGYCLEAHIVHFYSFLEHWFYFFLWPGFDEFICTFLWW